MSAASLGSRAIIGRFFAELAAYIGASWIPNISMLFTSDQESETYKWLGQSPMLREWIGGKNAKGLRDFGMTITNKDFEATLEVLRSEIRRDKTGQVMIRVAELAKRAGGHWAKLLSTLITNGTGDTSGNCYDGQYFFDSDHSEGDSGTQLNLLTNSQVGALDVTTATAPTQLEAAKAILGVIGYMLAYKDDQGEPMNMDAKHFIVMTSPVLWQFLAPAVYSQRAGSGETNPARSIIDNSGFKIDVVANPYLAYTTQFATFRADGGVKPFVCQEEVPIHMKVLGDGSDVEFLKAKHLYSAEAVRNVGYGYWQHAAHATMS